MVLQKAVVAPPLSWKTPRDTGSSQTSGDAQRNIRYGWLTALGTKDQDAKEKETKDLCRSRGTITKMRPVSAPPMLNKQATVHQPASMPPSSKDPTKRQVVRTLLNEDLIERTQYIVIYVQISLNELGFAGADWKQLATDFWGINEDSTLNLPGPATMKGTRTAIAELTQILLVEGALLFGRAEFDMMDRVRKLVEACMSLQLALAEVENAMLEAQP
jgi:hypothetical protein